MIPAAATTAEFSAGYIVLTSAETEAPILVHLDDLELLSCDFDGNEPSRRVHRVVEDCVVKTTVFEELDEVLALLREAKAALEERDRVRADEF